MSSDWSPPLQKILLYLVALDDNDRKKFEGLNLSLKQLA
tara:strand:+ start:389 stop:505 length:117 start_codon:yes stop_codon:yes gene_type:complete